VNDELEVVTDTEAGSAEVMPVAVDGPAFEAFASESSVDLSKPLVAIVLLDVGIDGIERDALYRLGVPVTFAVDPSAADAQSAAAAFNEWGFEVVAMVPDRGDLILNQRTPPAKAGSLLETYFENVPTAVAMIDRPLGDFYRNIGLVESIVQELKGSGHGLLIHERFGINAAVGSAAARRVPVAAVKRVIDTNRNEPAIRAALDRAVLEASKTGSVVVFGRTYPETIDAMTGWLDSVTAKSAQIAPLTASITK